MEMSRTLLEGERKEFIALNWKKNNKWEGDANGSSKFKLEDIILRVGSELFDILTFCVKIDLKID